MIPLPPNLSVQRSRAVEDSLYAQIRAWTEQEPRAEGIHASELLDPRRAYWARRDPQPLPDRLVTTFFVGRILHAFLLSGAVGRAASGSPKRSGSLGITYEPDDIFTPALGKQKVVREIKTTRQPFLPKRVGALQMYLEQLLIYMAAEETTQGRLDVLFLNTRDTAGRTHPSLGSYLVECSPEELTALRGEIARLAKLLTRVLRTRKYRQLPLCRDWMCSATQCPWWNRCRPEGRWTPHTKAK